MKICSRCCINKDKSNFSKKEKNKDGLNIWCVDCNKEYLRLYYLKNKESINIRSKETYKENSESTKLRSKKWRLENPDRHKEYFKKYYEENKDDLLGYKKEHYIENKDIYLEKSKRYREENPEKYSEYLKNWREENSEYSKEYLKEWHADNPGKRTEYWNKLRVEKPYIIAWRGCLWSALQRMGGSKESSTIDLLKYSASDLKNHMESLFEEGMSWNNWGEWHIDHKFPISKFDKNTPMHIVNSLDNLQPLWASENLSKNNKTDGSSQ